MIIRDQILALQTMTTSSTPGVEVSHEDMISVSSATRRAAFAYERFRNVLEPDEADILRRKAIYRILDRRLPEDKNIQVTTTLLLQELMRAHYIPNQPVSFAGTLSMLMSRIQAVWQELSEADGELFLRIGAVAIDRQLFPRKVEEELVRVMYQDVIGRVVWADDLLPEKDRLSQLYIACHRTLFAADDHEIFYHFFINQYPAFFDIVKEVGDTHSLATDLPAYLHALEEQVYHNVRERLYRIIRPSAVPYRVLLDVITSQSGDAFGDEKKLHTATRTAVQKKIEHIASRMSRRAWHAILFLFFTKTLVAIFVELPYELFLLSQAHWLALGVNIVFHPLLLFGAATTVRMPRERNTARIVDQVARLTTGDIMPNILVQKARRYGPLTWALFATVYTALFLLIFWRMFVLLDTLQFSLIGILIFVVFLGLVSFLATRIRRSVNDIRVIPKKEGVFGLFFSFLSLPILEFGRFLTTHISQLNIFLFVMDLVLEAPFKLLIDVVEEWFTFIRDRKEEIV